MKVNSMAKRLNISQAHELASNVSVPNGGFTVKAYGPEAGSPPPNESILVGISEHGMNDIPQPVAPADIQHFVDTRKGPLQEEQNYLGGWSPSGTKPITDDYGNQVNASTAAPAALDVTEAIQGWGPASRLEAFYKGYVRPVSEGRRPEREVGFHKGGSKGYSHSAPTAGLPATFF
jgi:hypothetical protein